MPSEIFEATLSELASINIEEADVWGFDLGGVVFDRHHSDWSSRPETVPPIDSTNQLLRRIVEAEKNIWFVSRLSKEWNFTGTRAWMQQHLPDLYHRVVICYEREHKPELISQLGIQVFFDDRMEIIEQLSRDVAGVWVKTENQ